MLFEFIFPVRLDKPIRLEALVELEFLDSCFWPTAAARTRPHARGYLVQFPTGVTLGRVELKVRTFKDTKHILRRGEVSNQCPPGVPPTYLP